MATGLGDAEADRFFAGFDFAAWNQACDAGRPWSEALGQLEQDHPEWLAHGRAYHEHFAASLVAELPATVAIVQTLHRAGVPQVGLTNWSAELWHHAPARFGFLELLADVVVSGEVGIAKPDPAIYRLAAERCGLPPHALVFVDDKPANAAAATAVGMRGLVFTDPAVLRTDLLALGLPVL